MFLPYVEQRIVITAVETFVDLFARPEPALTDPRARGSGARPSVAIHEVDPPEWVSAALQRAVLVDTAPSVLDKHTRVRIGSNETYPLGNAKIDHLAVGHEELIVGQMQGSSKPPEIQRGQEQVPRPIRTAGRAADAAEPKPRMVERWFWPLACQLQLGNWTPRS